jgi:hypothetical protein
MKGYFFVLESIYQPVEGAKAPPEMRHMRALPLFLQ